MNLMLFGPTSCERNTDSNIAPQDISHCTHSSGYMKGLSQAVRKTPPDVWGSTFVKACKQRTDAWRAMGPAAARERTKQLDKTRVKKERLERLRMPVPQRLQHCPLHTSGFIAVILASHENRDIQVLRSHSFKTLASASSAETFPLHDFENGVALHIAGWHPFAEQVSQGADGKGKARSILEFFAKAGKVSNTPCFTMFQEAIAVCNEPSATSTADQLSGAKKKTRSRVLSYACRTQRL